MSEEEEFWEKWMPLCGGDEELAIMLLNMFTRTIMLVSKEIDSSDDLLSFGDIDSYTKRRVSESMEAHATEEQIAFIFGDLVGQLSTEFQGQDDEESTYN